MKVAILIVSNSESIKSNDFDCERISKLLSYKGYDTEFVLNISEATELKPLLEYLKSLVNSIIVCGEVNVFYDYFSADYAMVKNAKILEIDEIIYAFMPKPSDSFINDEVIPSLNSKCKTFYTTAIFKTIGKTESELKEILKPYIKNKSRIAFKFIPSIYECEVNVRYSSKMSKQIVDTVLQGVTEALLDCTYAQSDITLEEQVADFLKVHNKKLCIAESFTGGAVASSLIKIAGMSSVLKESIVAYTNESKIRRLKVDENILNTFGAVSIECVYEMSANILLDSDCDVSVATTGNAGPTAEKDGENGLCFIAVGNKNGIHIYKYNFEGDRSYVTACGVKCALFQLYKNLNESEFLQMLKAHNQKTE